MYASEGASGQRGGQRGGGEKSTSTESCPSASLSLSSMSCRHTPSATRNQHGDGRRCAVSLITKRRRCGRAAPGRAPFRVRELSCPCPRRPRPRRRAQAARCGLVGRCGPHPSHERARCAAPAPRGAAPPHLGTAAPA